MVPSIFYGHNKQTAERKMCFCFPPVPGGRKGCCQEHQHHEEVGSCRVGTALLPAGSQGGGLCCTCQSSRAGSAFLPLPRPDLSQLQCPAHPTQLLLCAAPALQKEACTKWEEWAEAGSPAACSTQKTKPFLFTSKAFCLSPA